LNNFCVFILTHGRPDRVYTYDSLRSHGYTGKIYLVVDDSDITLPEYKERYKDELLIFNKADIACTFDVGDNFEGYRGVIYARNACFDLAEKVGCEYFLQVDDDYKNWYYKYNPAGEFGHYPIADLNKVFKLTLDFFESTQAISVAYAQNGDFIGGAAGTWAQKISMKRKCMNTFFCSVYRPFSFVGRINEDTNTYTSAGHKGELFITLSQIAINQIQTQSNASGMTDLYLDFGTYVKSFYTVMYAPSMAKIALMGSKHKRLHHQVSWNNAVPVILDQIHQKNKGQIQRATFYKVIN